MTSLKLSGIFLVILLAVSGVGYWYYNHSQNRIELLQTNNAVLKVAVQTSEASVKLLRQDAIRNAKLNLKLQTDLQKAELYGDELRSVLQKHNLTKLSREKPGLIQKRIQDATNKVWNDITNDTIPGKLR